MYTPVDPNLMVGFKPWSKLHGRVNKKKSVSLRQYTAINVSRKLSERAQEKNHEQYFIQTSCQELPSRGKFNTIVYINTYKILIY